jgi:hypothetical protein
VLNDANTDLTIRLLNAYEERLVGAVRNGKGWLKQRTA